METVYCPAPNSGKEQGMALMTILSSEYAPVVVLTISTSAIEVSEDDCIVKELRDLNK